MPVPLTAFMVHLTRSRRWTRARAGTSPCAHAGIASTQATSVRRASSALVGRREERADLDGHEAVRLRGRREAGVRGEEREEAARVRRGGEALHALHEARHPAADRVARLDEAAEIDVRV